MLDDLPKTAPLVLRARRQRPSDSTRRVCQRGLFQKEVGRSESAEATGQQARSNLEGVVD
jgi:hypothetical protein